MPPVASTSANNQLAQFFERATLQRGKAYYAQGKVLDYELGPHGITGSLAGSYEESYTTKVRASWAGDKLQSLDSTCSCPVGYLCKHGVALSLVMLAERSGQSSAKAGGNSVVKPSPALQRWLQKLEQKNQPANATESDKAVVYLLDIKTHNGEPGLSCLPYEVKRLKNGNWGKQLRQIRLQHGREAMLPSDFELAGLLRYAEDYGGHLRPERAAELMPPLLATGRCHWQTADSPPLELSAAANGKLAWRIIADGKMQLELTELADAVALPIDPPWYVRMVDEDQALCGPLQLNVEPRYAAALITAPPVAEHEAGEITRELLKITGGSVPTPLAVVAATGQTVASPKLLIAAGDDGTPTVELQFRYGEHTVPYRPNAAQLIIQQGDKWLSYQREVTTENNCAAELLAAGLSQRLVHRPQQFFLDSAEQWLEFSQAVLPSLRDAGWLVDYATGYQPLAVVEAAEWYAETDDGEIGWFSIALGIEVDGQRLNLLPLLVGWLRRLPKSVELNKLAEQVGEQAWLELNDGRWIKLPLSRLQPIFTTLLELYDDAPLTDDGELALPLVRASELLDLADDVPSLLWQNHGVLSEHAEKLKAFDGIASIAAPVGLEATLRPYQQEGFNWLNFLGEFGFSGILADDMGLGKTLQTLALLLHEKRGLEANSSSGATEHKPSLILAPTSLLSNWRNEARRFTPDITTVVLHGPNRKALFEQAATADVVITSYPLLMRDFEWHAEQSYYYAILDEAQAIKNPRSKITRQVRQLNSERRLCLTGTPVENHLDELWSLMHFLMPGLLGDHKSFQTRFRTPIEKNGDEGRRQALVRRVRPFMLRRTKQEVATDLPLKTEIIRSVPLAGKQLDLYETLRVALDQQLQSEIAKRGLGGSQIQVLDALLKLRQVCCDPRLVKVQAANKVKQSAKLELLMELLPELLEEGRSVLLFSQFTSMLELIELELVKRDIRYVKLTGSTRDRAAVIEAFQSGEVPLFLISLKAGGVGLNLTAADTVIHYDPWWNPAAENQATDRAHRIGQDKPVFVYKLLTENTIEDRIQALQHRKQALYDAVLSGGSAGQAKLTADDLSELFKPLDDVDREAAI